MHREVRQHRHIELEGRDPQPLRRFEPRREVDDAATDEPQGAARRFVEPRLRCTAVRAAQLDEPQAGGQLLREVDHERRAVFTQRVDRGRERAGRVHHDEITLVEELRQIVRVRVHDPKITAVRDHHPDRVARDAARLGRPGRFPHRRHHRFTSSLAAKRPLDRPFVQQRAQRRHHGLGQRTIGDVLAGERLLVHLRAHVAGVEGVHAHLRFLGREDVAELFQRGLRRAVPAPAFVGLAPGIGRDVHDGAVRRVAASGSASWTRPSGATTFTS